MRKELRDLVRFDPDDIRRAVQALLEEAQSLERQRQEAIDLAGVYRLLLRAHGFEEAEIAAVEVVPKMRPATLPDQERRFKGMKITDAVVAALSESGRKMHGSAILAALEGGGLRVGQKNGMGTLITAMRRDGRIEKDTSEKNTWRLRPQP
jgi:hypothetical protein